MTTVMPLMTALIPCSILFMILITPFMSIVSQGGISDYMKWVQAFPACVFGFTGMLLNSRKHHPELLKVVASMDFRRILLETDLPLLLPPKYHLEGIRHSNPLMIIDIAKEVARLCHLPTTTIMNRAHHNTIRFFHLTRQ